MTKTFVKLSEDHLSYQVFKNPISVDGAIKFINSDAGKNELGYYELDASYPAVDADHHAVRTAWQYSEELNKVVGVFEIVENEKVPRTFSKYKIMTCLMEQQLWGRVKEWIYSTEYSDFWDVPLDFNEADPYFVKGLQAFKAQFNFTDEQIEALLAACIKEF